MKYTDIIWDFDGTLINTYKGLTNAFQKALKDENLNEDLEEILLKMKVSLASAVDYYERKNNVKMPNFKENFLRYEDLMVIEETTPFPQVFEILEYVKKKGVRQYIITHRNQTIYKFLDEYNIRHYFIDIITRNDNFPKKPNPESFLHMIKKHGLDYKTTLAIGDREMDVLAGKNAGIDACLFSFEGFVESEHADYYIRDLGEIKKIIV